MNEKLFFSVWRNKYLIDYIVSFLKTIKKTSLLLPRFNGDINHLSYLYNKEIPQLYSSDNSNEKRYYGYNEITNVNKMTLHHKELLRIKVSRGELLNFSTTSSIDYSNIKAIPGLHIFNRYKDQELDIEFYNNLFKNYSIYFLNEKSTITIDSIIKCSLVALKVFLELSKFEITLNNYIFSIKYGSTEISKFLKESYGFQLNQKQLNKLFNYLLQVNEVDYYNEKEELEELNFEHIQMILTNCEIKKEFGYISKFGEPFIEVLKNRIFNYLENVEQCKWVPSKKLETPIQFIVGFVIQEKPLQFILDTCYSIAFFSDVIIDPEIFKFISSLGSIENVLLSKERLNEIKASLTKDDLIKCLEDLESTREDIKELVKMAIIFGGGYRNDSDLEFYLTKFGKKSYAKKFALEDGNFKHFNNYSINNSIQETAKEKLFRFHLNNKPIQKQFILDLISDINSTFKKKVNENETSDIINSGRGGSRGSSMRGGGRGGRSSYTYGDKCIKFPNLFNMIIAFDDLELMKFTLDEISNTYVGLSFLEYEKNNLFYYINSTEMFDLLISNQYLKSKFKFSNLFVEDGYEHNGKNLNLILNHFKLNYRKDYYEVDFRSSEIKHDFYFNDFFVENYQDFQKEIYNQKETLTKSWLLYFSQVQSTQNSQFGFLSLKSFIKVIDILKDHDQPNTYNCLNDPLILAWIYENRIHDLESGKCTKPLRKTLIEYYYYSNQFSKAVIKKNEKNEIIETITVLKNSKILPSIIKYNNLDDLELLSEFILSNKGIIETSNLKRLLFESCCKYNNLNVFKLLTNKFGGIKDDIQYILETIDYLEYCCIDIIDELDLYLITK